VFTVRYAPCPYTKQTHLVFKVLSTSLRFGEAKTTHFVFSEVV